MATGTLRDSGLSLATAGSNFVLGIALSVLVARALGPTGRGEYALVITTANIAFMVVNLGLGQSLVYHIGRELGARGAVFGTSLAVGVPLGLMAVAALALLYAAAGAWIWPGVSGGLLLLAAAATPLTLTNHLVQQFLVATGRVGAYGILGVIGIASSLALMAVALLLLGWGVFGAVVVGIVNSSLVAILGLALARNHAGLHLGCDRALLLRLLSFGARGHLGPLSAFLTYRLNTFLVNAFLGATALGHFAVGVSTAEAVLLLPNAVALILLPRTSSLPMGESATLVQLVNRTTIAVTAVAVVALAVVGRLVIVGFYGVAYAPAIEPFLVLLPGMVLLGVPKILSTYITGRGKPQFNSLFSMVALLFNLAANLALIPRYGLVGAALASTLAYAMMATFYVAAFAAMSRSGVWRTVLPQPQDAGLYLRAVGDVATTSWAVIRPRVGL